MNRIDLEAWLDRHPGPIPHSTHDWIDRCEAEVRVHADVVAWKHALKIATTSLRHFDARFGLPASETFVTREVCHEVARNLERHEPRLDAIDESEWLSRFVLDAIEPESRLVFHDWLQDLAEKEEHRAWRQIVSFTHHAARALIEREHMTGRLEWDLERSYPKLAVRVTRLLLREFASHLRESRRSMAAESVLH